ncbi:hypothetical protein MKW98_027412 [Papaver atlanticum]|uniref:Uncharacterized protein n=1 Tax=Papaver atlanticum TaxID=357466 RepID=A0AAD4TH51_9MAGN|nr:hypothetical protein MKW98_027412 [Papaver atlanticum]
MDGNRRQNIECIGKFLRSINENLGNPILIKCQNLAWKTQNIGYADSIPSSTMRWGLWGLEAGENSSGF